MEMYRSLISISVSEALGIRIKFAAARKMITFASFFTVINCWNPSLLQMMI